MGIDNCNKYACCPLHPQTSTLPKGIKPQAVRSDTEGVTCDTKGVNCDTKGVNCDL